MAMKFGNGIDLDNQRIVNLADPSSATDAVNKQYADALTRNLSWKLAVRAASTANMTLASAVINGASMDGVTLATGDRVLLKNQSSAAENGIYVVVASGLASRATDADTATELKGATVTVQEGTVAGDKVYRLITDNVTLGSTSLSWTEVGGGGTTYTAGSGLSESPAGTFNVDTGTSSATLLEISSDTVRISADAAGAGLTGGAGSALAVGAGTGITVNANDVALSASVAGAALTHTAGVLDVATGAGLEISSDTVRIAAAAAGSGLTGGAGSALAVGAGNGITVNADDVALASSSAGAGLTYTTGVLAVGAGSGISVAADAIAVDSTVVRQYNTSVGDNSTTNIVVTHSLGTRDVQVTVRNASTPWEQVLVDNEATSTTTVTLRFATAPTTNQYRVTIQGAV